MKRHLDDDGDDGGGGDTGAEGEHKRKRRRIDDDDDAKPPFSQDDEQSLPLPPPPLHEDQVADSERFEVQMDEGGDEGGDEAPAPADDMDVKIPTKYTNNLRLDEKAPLLNDASSKVVQALVAGTDNVLLLGPAFSGKTTILRAVTVALRAKGKNVLYLDASPAAASYLGCSSLSSLVRQMGRQLFSPQLDPGQLSANLLQYHFVNHQTFVEEVLSATHVLVIRGLAYCPAKVFNMYQKLFADLVKRRSGLSVKPFGGIRIVASADFGGHGVNTDVQKAVFMSTNFVHVFPTSTHVKLETSIVPTCLVKARKISSGSHINTIESKVCPEPMDAPGEEPILILPSAKQVLDTNVRNMTASSIPEDHQKSFESLITSRPGREMTSVHIKEMVELAKDVMPFGTTNSCVLCIGARVLYIGHDPQFEDATLGKIVAFHPETGNPMVKFLGRDGSECEIVRELWQYRRDQGTARVDIKMMPLIPAYAFNIEQILFFGPRMIKAIQTAGAAAGAGLPYYFMLESGKWQPGDMYSILAHLDLDLVRLKVDPIQRLSEEFIPGNVLTHFMHLL